MIPTPVHTTGSHERVTRAIEVAAQRSGVDFDYLYQQARLESGFNPAARARTSSATGLYQFIDQTWLATVERHGASNGLSWAADAIQRQPNGRYRIADPAMRQQIMALRTNPEVASAMAAGFAADNRDYLERRVDRPIEGVDLYLAHFLGSGGASRFLRNHAVNPDRSAADLFPSAASANRSIFYSRGRARSLDEVRDLFARRMGAAGTTVQGNSPRVERPTTDSFPTPSSLDMIASASGPRQVQARSAYASIAYLTLAQLGG